jgi:hypothetical protein
VISHGRSGDITDHIQIKKQEVAIQTATSSTKFQFQTNFIVRQ